jgi:hypothetical protein
MARAAWRPAASSSGYLLPCKGLGRTGSVSLEGHFGSHCPADTIGGVKLNREAGTAKLTVRVPGPGDVRLIETARLKAAGARAAAEGRVKLPVMPKRKAKELLDQQGRARVKAKVTFDPDDGPIEKQPRPIVLRQKARA